MNKIKHAAVTIISLLALLGAIIGVIVSLAHGSYFIALAIFVSFCAWGNFLAKYQEREINELKNIIASRGLNIDFLNQTAGVGVVIDMANKKLLMGDLKTATIVGFDEIKSIECEDVPRGNRIEYSICAYTNSFEVPRVGLAFNVDRDARNLIYAKLRAAINS